MQRDMSRACPGGGVEASHSQIPIKSKVAGGHNPFSLRGIDTGSRRHLRTYLNSPWLSCGSYGFQWVTWE